MTIAVSCTAGCHAKITRFDATPRHVCPGDRVELVWELQGAGTMTVTPPTAHAPTGRVADRGTAVIHPTERTSVVLDVTRTGGTPTGAQLDIEMTQGEVVAASIADPSAVCRDGVVSSTAHLRDFAPDLRVAEIGVQPGDPHVYDVMHADERTHLPMTAAVSQTARTTRFAGQPLNGDWVISSSLPSGVSCDSPDLPGNLVVVAYTQCGDGGQP